jgi:hypothetical protein
MNAETEDMTPLERVEKRAQLMNMRLWLREKEERMVEKGELADRWMQYREGREDMERMGRDVFDNEVEVEEFKNRWGPPDGVE